MSLENNFQTFIHQQNLFQPKDKLLLAVSGGVDSVVLCELCYRCGFDFAIAHCNFQLRGNESDRDEEFVKQLAEKYQKPFFVKRFETERYAIEKKISIQVAARELRYAWFTELVDRWQMTVDSPNSNTGNWQLATGIFLATAHHLNDSIETMLMNFFKGTGISGLHGILSKQGKIIRPLLFATKEEIIQFATENHLQWVEDSSNDSDKYARNHLRHHIIPAVEKIYPELINNLSSNIERFRDLETLYHQSILQHKKKLLEQKGNEIHVPVLKLKKSEPLNTIIYEIIKDFDFTSGQVDEVINLLDSESGKYIESSSHRIIKNRNWIIIAPNNVDEANNIVVDDINCQLSIVNYGSIHFEVHSTTNYKLQTSNSIAQLDASKIKFPLIVRNWKLGDYFYPLGMKKKKKLARFFIDNKLSQTQKEKIRVIEMNKKIIWVIGMRIDERFKITPQTKEIVKISFNSSKKPA
ncbi:MAG: tRNA lysidine(34) synthetase TilS [Bacteroidetes bacterium]|nr:tRNA lysidine(34) synthetase TilS [Bacteroidota bacterium]